MNQSELDSWMATHDFDQAFRVFSDSVIALQHYYVPFAGLASSGVAYVKFVWDGHTAIKVYLSETNVEECNDAKIALKEAQKTIVKLEKKIADLQLTLNPEPVVVSEEPATPKPRRKHS